MAIEGFEYLVYPRYSGYTRVDFILKREDNSKTEDYNFLLILNCERINEAREYSIFDWGRTTAILLVPRSVAQLTAWRVEE